VLNPWRWPIFWVVILYQLYATAGDPVGTVAGLAAVATTSAVSAAAGVVGRDLAAVATTSAAGAAAGGWRGRRGCDSGYHQAVSGRSSQSSGSRKSRKTNAGTFPSRLRAVFQCSLLCKPLCVTRAADSPPSSSKPSMSSRPDPLPNQLPSYYEALMKYGSCRSIRGRSVGVPASVTVGRGPVLPRLGPLRNRRTGPRRQPAQVRATAPPSPSQRKSSPCGAVQCSRPAPALARSVLRLAAP
jgi:hypothetical protein